MKSNKQLDKLQKSKIPWILRYRDMAYYLITHTDRKVWEGLVKLSDTFIYKNKHSIVIDALKWALAEEFKDHS